MRSLGLIGLVLALLVVGVLVKKQMTVVAPATAVPAGASQGADVRTQSQQIQQQVRESVDAAMQPRPMPDDVK
ncbi:MAG: hypothetical protein EOP81_08235 [Variovorax sp.]|nr:MAG: hypothetical protein EOP81_08235 [Variovorax sp.]